METFLRGEWTKPVSLGRYPPDTLRIPLIILIFDSEMYPLWSSELLPAVEYKYLIQTSDGITRWEKMEGNRVFERSPILIELLNVVLLRCFQCASFWLRVASKDGVAPYFFGPLTMENKIILS
eukprot:GHVN01057387.1.p1 GENE.GHVN01057387.1~~GHVN01057387.1.p1  ORF type:complete len:123 (+),score=1.55 GHVN01057387.1:310-678(+)